MGIVKKAVNCRSFYLKDSEKIEKKQENTVKEIKEEEKKEEPVLIFKEAPKVESPKIEEPEEMESKKVRKVKKNNEEEKPLEENEQ